MEQAAEFPTTEICSIDFDPIHIHGYFFSFCKGGDSFGISYSGKCSSDSEIEEYMEVMVEIIVSSAYFADVECVKRNSVDTDCKAVFGPVESIGVISPVLKAGRHIVCMIFLSVVVDTVAVVDGGVQPCFGCAGCDSCFFPHFHYVDFSALRPLFAVVAQQPECRP